MKPRHLTYALVSLLWLMLQLSVGFVHAQVSQLTVEIVAELYIDDLGSTETIEWSPDGQFLAVGGTGGILLFDENLEVTIHFLPDVFRVFTLNWSPDGSRIAAIYGAIDETQIAIINVFTGNAQVIESPFLVTPIVWSPMGSQIVFGFHDRTTVVIDAVTWETIFSFQGEEDLGNLNHTSDYCWLSESELVASYGLHTYIFSLPNGTLTNELLGGNPNTVDCLPSASLMITASGTFRDLETGEWQHPFSRDNGEWQSMLGDGIFGFDIALHPNGEYFAINAALNSVQIYSPNPHIGLLAEMEGGIYEPNINVIYFDDSIHWHPDGELLAAVGEDNIVRIWRVEEGS